MSRFVSSGTDEESTDKDNAWRQAQEQIEATRRDKAEPGKQECGKSLYETLQANKAAKQEKFEESIRLKHQFQALNDDEVEFLDSVLETTRAKEEAVRRQTAEEVDTFRRQQQEEAERAAKKEDGRDDDEAAGAADSTTWTVSKKRRRAREGLLGSVKLRKASTSEDKASSEVQKASEPARTSADDDAVNNVNKVKQDVSTASAGSERLPASSSTVMETASQPKTLAAADTSASPSLGLGLGAYSSDEDE